MAQALAALVLTIHAATITDHATMALGVIKMPLALTTALAQSEKVRLPHIAASLTRSKSPLQLF
jgi:hypothetical protein